MFVRVSSCMAERINLPLTSMADSGLLCILSTRQLPSGKFVGMWCYKIQNGVSPAVPASCDSRSTPGQAPWSTAEPALHRSAAVKLILALTALSCLAEAAAIGADARRGAIVFEQQKCSVCHTPSSGSPGNAPVFDRRRDRDYTPAGIASRMWNHAPRMWGAIRDAEIELPRLTKTDAADLFAFFYARGFFEKRGDMGRGKKVFQGKCARCHSSQGPGEPAARWKPLVDSVELVQRLWNHSPEMVKALEARKRPWPELSAEELTDLLTYAQSPRQAEGTAPAFRLPAGTGGKALLASKGCTRCHYGRSALEGKLGGQTLTMIAASMWNHAPVARQTAAELSEGEMRDILAYIWSTDFFRSRGDVASGREVFALRCALCHGNPSVSAPDLRKTDQGYYTAITMVWALWAHGPKMLREIESQKQNWPELSESEMENLIAFLDFKLRRRPRRGGD